MPDYLTADELRRLLPGISPDVLKLSASDAPRNRSRAELQKHQDAHQGQAHHVTKKAGVDAKSSGHYRITIAFRVSDHRERDGDGGEATLLDCLVRARKRLLQMPDRVLMALYERSKRAGGSIDPD